MLVCSERSTSIYCHNFGFSLLHHCRCAEQLLGGLPIYQQSKLICDQTCTPLGYGRRAVCQGYQDTLSGGKFRWQLNLQPSTLALPLHTEFHTLARGVYKGERHTLGATLRHAAKGLETRIAPHTSAQLVWITLLHRALAGLHTPFNAQLGAPRTLVVGQRYRLIYLPPRSVGSKVTTNSPSPPAFRGRRE